MAPNVNGGKPWDEQYKERWRDRFVGAAQFCSSHLTVCQCTELLMPLLQMDEAKPFLEPVHPEVFPDYHTINQRPMDFGTIQRKLNDSK